MKKKYNPWKRYLNKRLVEDIEKLKPDSVEFLVQKNEYVRCMITRGNEIAKGYAICSILDKFDEKEGRNRAAGRAVKAMKNKKCNEIKRNSLANLPKTWSLRQAFRFLSIPIYFKSHYEIIK